MIRSLSPRLLSGLFVLTVLGCTCLGANSSKKAPTPEEYKQQLRQVDLQKLTEQERVLLAQFTIQGLQSTLQNTQQVLAALLQQAQTFEQRKSALMDSDEGKRVAANDLTLRRFNRLDENPVASVAEIKSNGEAASTLAAILKVSADRPEVGHIPSSATEKKVHDLSFWAEDRLASLKQQQSELNSVLRDAVSDVDISKKPSLRAALEQHRSRWPTFVNDAETKGEAQAAVPAETVLVEASKLAMLQKALARAEEINRKNQAEIAAIKADMDITLLKKQAETDELLAVARVELKKAQEKIRQLEENAKVEIEIANRTEEDKRTAQLEELRQKQLEIKADSPRVRQVLAPFITSGYWQPGSNKPTYNRGPVSRKQLGQRKALEDTPDGLQALLRIGIDKSDKVRPRWPWSMYLGKLSPTQMDELREAQQYLIELGDILVKKGMLTDE
jgi:hypothetical protein